MRFGPQAKDKADPAYVSFKMDVTAQFKALVAKPGWRAIDVKPEQPGPVTYDWLAALARNPRRCEVLIGIQDGRCVAYWQYGAGDALGEFYRAVGGAPPPAPKKIE